MVFEFNNYRGFLRASLTARMEKNSRYSLRAMAQQLGISNSNLSEVMNGKSNFSTTAMRKVAKGLRLTPQETEYLCLLVELDSATDPDARAFILERMRALNPANVPAHDVSVDQFRQISEWYHSAILEMVYLANFPFEAAAISSRLGISRHEARAAIDRLKRLGLIRKDASGRYVRTNERLLTQSPTANTALRSFYRQMLEKASSAIESQGPDERLSGYETFPVAPEQLPQIRAAMNRFLDEVQTLTQSSPQSTQVYHALVHVFNLTAGKGAR
ncbi:MAG TPA: TIGR02147 family protein [Bdellovibrionota bacterium]|nr:TIGR02147 family protein [Bdellovibrionota bacterium]